MSEDAPQPKSYFIRNDKGKVWGPMQASTLAILIPQGAFPGRLQASEDGERYAMIGRFAELREVLPQEVWGVSPDEVAAGAAPAEAAAAPPGAVPTVSPEDLAPGAPTVSPEALAPGAPTVSPEEIAAPPSGAASRGAQGAGPRAPSAPAAAAPPPAAAVPEVEIPTEGTLAETSLFRLAYLIAAKKATCRVILESGGTTSTVSFRKGAPEHIASEDPALDLGRWLVAAGHLSEEARAEAEAAKASFGGSLATALFARGLLDPNAAFPHLATYLQEAYGKLLALESGGFRVEEGAPPPDAVPLGQSPFLLLVAAMRSMPVEAVRRRLGPRLKAPAMKSNVSAVPIEALKLGPQETRLYGLYDGVRTLEALAAAAGEQEALFLRLSFLLAETEFLSFG
ncbi:MAG: DUF4388 domain-containing protein, partial [Deltaproteobacteria bacterium]